MKMDAATRHQKNYLGLNVQYYESGKIQVKTLALIDTEGQHSSASVRKMVEDTLYKFSITKDQILSVSGDNAANMTHAITLLNENSDDDNFGNFTR